MKERSLAKKHEVARPAHGSRGAQESCNPCSYKTSTGGGSDDCHSIVPLDLSKETCDQIDVFFFDKEWSNVVVCHWPVQASTLFFFSTPKSLTSERPYALFFAHVDSLVRMAACSVGSRVEEKKPSKVGCRGKKQWRTSKNGLGALCWTWTHISLSLCERNV